MPKPKRDKTTNGEAMLRAITLKKRNEQWMAVAERRNKVKVRGKRAT